MPIKMKQIRKINLFHFLSNLCQSQLYMRTMILQKGEQ